MNFPLFIQMYTDCYMSSADLYVTLVGAVKQSLRMKRLEIERNSSIKRYKAILEWSIEGFLAE